MTTDPHAAVADKLSAYVDGELGKDDNAAVEEHLAMCPRCRESLEKLRQTIGKLAGLKDRAPSSLLPSIQQQIHRRSRGRFFAKRWMLFGRIPFEWISLVMIVAMLVYYITVLQSAPTGVTPAP